eukprot:gnl/MRDRNA2_/MRDRNA2_81367_c0_seq1.p1 gnl/MRDRNA2_/MRDRNA2_81367_c0~~gnl/MRDRNA2_/MRDRNA2_81367_c0_seq1.p1  ORF type:complete len:708 (+),score=198.69 gnl/MRDRNA2_/MRDRNA2_81367_c0_seq1:306-2126(+)
MNAALTEEAKVRKEESAQAKANNESLLQMIRHDVLLRAQAEKKEIVERTELTNSFHQKVMALQVQVDDEKTSWKEQCDKLSQDVKGLALSIAAEADARQKESARVLQILRDQNAGHDVAGAALHEEISRVAGAFKAECVRVQGVERLAAAERGKLARDLQQEIATREELGKEVFMARTELAEALDREILARESGLKAALMERRQLKQEIQAVSASRVASDQWAKDQMQSHYQMLKGEASAREKLQEQIEVGRVETQQTLLRQAEESKRELDTVRRERVQVCKGLATGIEDTHAALTRMVEGESAARRKDQEDYSNALLHEREQHARLMEAERSERTRVMESERNERLQAHEGLMSRLANLSQKLQEEQNTREAEDAKLHHAHISERKEFERQAALERQKLAGDLSREVSARQEGLQTVAKALDREASLREQADARLRSQHEEIIRKLRAEADFPKKERAESAKPVSNVELDEGHQQNHDLNRSIARAESELVTDDRRVQEDDLQHRMTKLNGQIRANIAARQTAAENGRSSSVTAGFVQRQVASIENPTQQTQLSSLMRQTQPQVESPMRQMQPPGADKFASYARNKHHERLHQQMNDDNDWLSRI